MPEGLLAEDQRQHFVVGDLTRRWVGGIGLAAAVGLGYFLAADFSVRLVLKPEGVAVFWPAAGLSSGLLIALGPRARWPVLILTLLAAAVAGTSASGIGGAVTYRLLRGPSASLLETWQHWFASDAIGIIAVAPLVIGLAAVVRRRRHEAK
jgi:integral membrane sensor domain MASE1